MLEPTYGDAEAASLEGEQAAKVTIEILPPTHG